ncbi:TPA: hypothetical protein JG914_004667 [Enterobacter hormaechei subsp. steigerwaltii]|nr:hypothetical protein [Enterobacter hormaechei subsp. steigerwaltii]
MQAHKNDIFISIASYRDPELLPTLINLVKKARHAEVLRIVVCWQDDEDFSVFERAGITFYPRRPESRVSGFQRFFERGQNRCHLHASHPCSRGWLCPPSV